MSQGSSQPQHSVRLLQLGDAARALGVSNWTLVRWSDAGLVPVLRLPSGRRRFRPEDLDALMRQMVAAGAPR